MFKYMKINTPHLFLQGVNGNFTPAARERPSVRDYFGTGQTYGRDQDSDGMTDFLFHMFIFNMYRCNLFRAIA